MKNKGRKHKAGNGEINFSGTWNCKGALTLITRDIRKMSNDPITRQRCGKKFLKKAWSKRVRGYFKSQTKDLLNELE